MSMNKEFKNLGIDDLNLKIIELKKELMKLNAQKSTGSSLKNPGLVRQTRKNIARILTLIRQKEIGGISNNE